MQVKRYLHYLLLLARDNCLALCYFTNVSGGQNVVLSKMETQIYGRETLVQLLRHCNIQVISNFINPADQNLVGRKKNEINPKQFLKVFLLISTFFLPLRNIKIIKYKILY